MKRALTLGGVVVLAAMFGAVTATAGQAKVEICHSDDSGAYHLIEVAEPAYEAHVAHGDARPGETVPDMTGYRFDATCVPQQIETVFAIAYTDTNPSDGAYDPDVDTLIAKLVDGPNADGIPGPGDVVITDQYPVDIDATGFLGFQVTEHSLDAVQITAGPGWKILHATGSTGNFTFYYQPGYAERYTEQVECGPYSCHTWFHDYHAVGSTDDSVVVSLGSPSEPVGNLLDFGTFRLQDDPFVDIEVS